MNEAETAAARAHREEWARLVATLARRFGDLGLAEEAASEAFATAVERWPTDGVPPNPGAWLTTTASRKAIDLIRRENKRDDKYKEAMMMFVTALGADFEVDVDMLRDALLHGRTGNIFFLPVRAEDRLQSADQGAITPTLFPSYSVNQILPSAPATMPTGELFGVGVGNSVNCPAVVSRPI